MKKSRILLVMLCLAAMLLIPACQNDTPEPEKVWPPVETPEYVAAPKRTGELAPVKTPLSEENPYATKYYGLHDNQTATFKNPRLGKDDVATPFDQATAHYSLYIPQGTETRSPLVIVLIPDGERAHEFADSRIGKEWIELAGKDPVNKFAVAFVEPAGKWNTTLNPNGRNEALAIFGVFKTINNTSVAKGNTAFYSLDKNRVSLVGYGEGAEAALYAAAQYPTAYANLTLIDLPKYDSEILSNLLAEDAFPYLTSNTNGLGELKNSDVAMPVFVLDSYASCQGTEAAEVYKTNNAAHKIIDSTEKKELIRVVSLDKDITVEKMYEDFLASNGRYLGYPGGTIRENITRDMKGYTLVQDGSWEFQQPKTTGYPPKPVLDEKGNPVMNTRTHFNKFLVYVPENLPAGPRPLVLALHGNSAALNDLISESRWADIADKEGLIICFVQGTMAPDGAAPTPGWPKENTVKQLEHDIEYMKAHYEIDASRIYAAGHSAGAMTLGGNVIPVKPELCAAYSMNGGMMGGAEEAGKVLAPCTGQMAQYDFGSMDPTYEGMKSFVDSFIVVNGMDPATAMKSKGTDPKLGEGKYNMYEACIDEKPVVQFIGVKQSPHVFMAEEAQLAWNFMKHWSRTEEGSFYDGTLVKMPEQKPADKTTDK